MPDSLTACYWLKKVIFVFSNIASCVFSAKAGRYRVCIVTANSFICDQYCVRPPSKCAYDCTPISGENRVKMGRFFAEVGLKYVSSVSRMRNFLLGIDFLNAQDL